MTDSLAIFSLSLKSAPTSPPTRYLDLLPPELLRHILHFIDILPYSDRGKRQRTLYFLSLSSKLLHELAQPLLLKRIYSSYPLFIDETDILAALVAQNSAESLVKVQTLHLTVHTWGYAFDETDLEELVGEATKLQEVLIEGESRVVQILGGTSKLLKTSFRCLNQPANSKFPCLN